MPDRLLFCIPKRLSEVGTVFKGAKEAPKAIVFETIKMRIFSEFILFAAFIISKAEGDFLVINQLTSSDNFL